MNNAQDPPKKKGGGRGDLIAILISHELRFHACQISPLPLFAKDGSF